MKKAAFLLFASLALASCSTLFDFFPDQFDDVEYEYLTLLHLSADKQSCDALTLTTMSTYSNFLVAYTEYRNNAGTKEIYQGINDLVEELAAREKPSAGYCRIKTNNIAQLTDTARSVFAKRK